jgi:hypothetical protein
MNIIIEDKTISYSERRELAQFPVLSKESLVKGAFFTEFETYCLDQFAFREGFRQIKSIFEINVLNKQDINGIYLYEEQLVKVNKPYDQQSVEHMVTYLNEIQEAYFLENKVYFSIIPDKNYYVSEGIDSEFNYEEMEATLVNGLSHMTYIDIFDELKLEDYYRLDTHWKQEALLPVLNKMGEVMAFTTDFNQITYTQHSYDDFYGVYYGQAALNLPGDVLIYLESAGMENVTIVNYEALDNKNLQIYDESQLGQEDAYNVFLSGASPLIEITNTNSKNNKGLIIFRDSFGSSLGPLLLDEYSKITLIDTRYMAYETIDQYMTITDEDILFIYNTAIINNSQMLR